MFYTSIVTKLLASAILAVSVVIPSKTPEQLPSVAMPTSTIAVVVVPSLAKELAISQDKKLNDCSKYTSIMEKYDWATTTAMSVCKAESGGNPRAVGDSDTEFVSCGLMQIRTIVGRPTCEELKDPETNIAYAYYLWSKEGWTPWSVCRTLVSCK